MKYYLLITDGTIKRLKKDNYILNINKKLKELTVDDYIYAINTRKASVVKYKLKKIMSDSLVLKKRETLPFYEANLNDVWFDKINNKSKTVEGRLDKGKFNLIEPRSFIVFSNSKGAKVLVRVKEKVKYASFSDMMKEEGLDNVLPGISSLVDGVNVYRKFYSEDVENTYGVVAIRIEKINPHLM